MFASCQLQVMTWLATVICHSIDFYLPVANLEISMAGWCNILPLACCYLAITIHRLPIANQGITFAICGLPIAFHVHCQLPLANHRLLIANHQFAIFQAIIASCHCRFTVSSCQLYTHVFTEGQKATGNDIISNWQIGNWQM